LSNSEFEKQHLNDLSPLKQRKLSHPDHTHRVVHIRDTQKKLSLPAANRSAAVDVRLIRPLTRPCQHTNIKETSQTCFDCVINKIANLHQAAQ
jgi:hypothetical protein